MGVACQRILQTRLVDGEARRSAASASARDTLASSRRLSISLYAITGSITLSWKLPDCPATEMVTSLPMTSAATIAVASGITGLTLPGMMLLPGLQRRQRDLAKAGQRPAVHPAQVIGDLHQADRQGLQLAGKLHRRILGGDAFEQAGVRTECDAGCFGSSLQKRAAKSGWGIDAGAYCRAALRQLQQACLHGSQPLHALLNLGAPGCDLLTEGHRHGIHQMRASGLDDVADLGLFLAEHRSQMRKRRLQRLAPQQGRTYMDGSGNDVIAALPHVHFVIGMHRATQAL